MEHDWTEGEWDAVVHFLRTEISLSLWMDCRSKPKEVNSIVHRCVIEPLQRRLNLDAEAIISFLFGKLLLATYQLCEETSDANTNSSKDSDSMSDMFMNCVPGQSLDGLLPLTIAHVALLGFLKQYAVESLDVSEVQIANEAKKEAGELLQRIHITLLHEVRRVHLCPQTLNSSSIVESQYLQLRFRQRNNVEREFPSLCHRLHYDSSLFPILYIGFAEHNPHRRDACLTREELLDIVNSAVISFPQT